MIRTCFKDKDLVLIQELVNMIQLEIKIFTVHVELQWLEQAWDHENWFQSKVVPTSQGKFLCL